MASAPRIADRTDTTATALAYTGGGRLLHVSLPFVNDLISLLSTLPSSFEEDLARISSEQRYAERVDKNAPKEKKMLVVSAECEEYLCKAMWKLHKEEKHKYDVLVEKYPGTGGIIGVTDPRRNETVILGDRVNL